MVRLELHTRHPHEESDQEQFLRWLEGAVRHNLAWHPQASSATLTATGPDGKVYTGWAVKTGKGDAESGIEEGESASSSS